jgi:transcriptional regulator with XRE-family HTH domain
MTSNKDETQPLAPTQAKAARALLGWSQGDLAREAKVGASTVADFERGQRNPVANNLTAMREALERQGVVFTSGGVVFGKDIAFPVVTSVSTADLRPVQWVDTLALSNWADRISTRELLPELIRRLMLARFGYAAEIRFPSGEAIQLHGWDGLSNVQSNDALIPSGLAGWEMGVNRSPRQKADDDYEARTSNPGHLKQDEATFVFVTPRGWGGKEVWAEAKRREGKWRDVRVIDGVDLVQLLEQTPAVALWLAEQVGRIPRGVQLLADAWKEWALSTARPMSEDLVLSGRDQVAASVHRWLNTDPSSFSLRAESTTEAVAFLYAAVCEYPASIRDMLLSRTVVITTPEMAREIANVPVPLVAVLSEMEPSVAALLNGKGHHVFLAYGSEIAAPIAAAVLPRAGRYAIAEELKALRMSSDEADQLARDSGGSLTVMRRLMAPAPGVVSPIWAQSDQARRFLPLLLAGAWDDSNQLDQDAISKLGDIRYPDVIANMTEALALPESPVRQVGRIWKIASPRDAWFRLSPYLTIADLDRFEQVAMEVLGSHDPSFERRGKEWSFDDNPARTYSETLKKGLAETLALIGVFGGQHRTIDHLQYRSTKVVRLLLKDADAARWWSLADHLRELAEASPEEFLAAIDGNIAKNDPAILALFQEEDGLFGGAHHADLLWSLEMLSWSPDHLAQVTDLLLRLAEIDPKGKWSNRPSNSLRQIYVLWMPQTFATQDERFEVLDSMRQRHPGVMWNLVLDLYPKSHEIGHHSPKPLWRSFEGGGQAEVITNRSIWNAEKVLAGWIAQDIGTDVARWVQALNRLNDFSPDLREKLTKLARALPKKLRRPEDRAALCAALRTTIHRHRQFADAGWAVGEAEVAELERVHNALESKDSVERLSWLFDQDHALLLNPPGTDFHEAERLSREARSEAVKVIFAEQGEEGIWAIAKLAKWKRLVGQALADVFGREPFEDFWRKVVDTDDIARREVATGVLVTLAADEDWGNRLIDRALVEEWNPDAVGGVILASLPFSHSLYERVNAVPEPVGKAFWRHVWHFKFDRETDRLPWAARGLIRSGRVQSAMELVSREPVKVPTGLLVEVLDAVLEQQTTPEAGNDSVMFQYYLEQIFAALDQHADMDLDQLGRLEWAYLKVLDNSARPPRALFHRLATNPEFFTEVVCAIYRSDGSVPTPELNLEELEAAKAIANNAWTLLHGWHEVPGLNDNNVVQRELDRWVDKARQLCGAQGRGDIGDEKMGEVFAYSPADDTGQWPCLAVRNLIERVRSEHIESGFYIGTRNSRGVTTRGVFDGGALERGEAAQYAAYAKAARLRWPRTAGVLERLARSYSAEAIDFDNEGERRQL